MNRNNIEFTLRDTKPHHNEKGRHSQYFNIRGVDFIAEMDTRQKYALVERLVLPPSSDSENDDGTYLNMGNLCRFTSNTQCRLVGSSSIS